MTKKQLIVAVILFFLVGSVLWFGYQIVSVPNQPVNVKEFQELEVKNGTTSKQFARQLEKEDIVKDTSKLKLYLKLHPNLNNIKTGNYDISKVRNMGELLSLVNKGKSLQLSIQLPEGSTFKGWQKIISRSSRLTQSLSEKSESEIYDLLDLPRDTLNTSVEGWLYPDTYQYAPFSTDLELLQRASTRLKYELNQAWQNRDSDLPLKSPYELLILASIVQKESTLAEEQPIIASVFINRLRKGMRLQTDPTVIYGMGSKFKGNITKRDLRTPTPYNTYVIYGLPPTPISMVTKTALQAVANPAHTNYIFFVADGTGKHKFSETLEQHNQAVKEYLRWYRQNRRK